MKPFVDSQKFPPAFQFFRMRDPEYVFSLIFIFTLE